jgi:hypothetical protein
MSVCEPAKPFANLQVAACRGERPAVRVDGNRKFSWRRLSVSLPGAKAQALEPPTGTAVIHSHTLPSACLRR